EWNSKFHRGVVFGRCVSDGEHFSRVVPMFTEDLGEGLDLGLGRPVEARKVVSKIATPHDVNKLFQRSPRNYVHRGLAMHLAEEILGARYEWTGKHGIVNQLRVLARQLLDATVVDIPVKNVLFEIPKLQSACHAAVSTLMFEYSGKLCRILIGVDL